MRLVNCKRVQGDFVGGEQVIQELLKDKKGSDSPNVQMAAASLYQAWGGSSEPDAGKKYQIAIQGTKSPPMWGWGQTALRLSGHCATSDPKIEAMEFEARYNLGRTQLALAKQQSTPADRDKTLNRAKMDLDLCADLQGAASRRGSSLYRTLHNDIQKEGGELPTALPVGIGAVAPVKPEVVNGAAQKPAVAAPVVDPAEETNAPQSRTNVGLYRPAGLGWYRSRRRDPVCLDAQLRIISTLPPRAAAAQPASQPVVPGPPP